MENRLLMGNEAVAMGALEAGVQVVTGYPGTPSTEILETVARERNENTYVEWSVNEKVAMEVAAGAAYAGARTLVTMKQVGLNVAADPLMSLTYIGVKGGMVVAVADDPGPHSSQTEQDTRAFGKFSNLPIFDPSSPQEAYLMIKKAYDLSQEMGIPVILRLTTRICHSCGTVALANNIKKNDIKGFSKDPRWVIFPKLAYKRHEWLENLQTRLSEVFSQSPFNEITGKGRVGIAASGIAHQYVADVLGDREDVTLLKVGTPYPFPQRVAIDFLTKVDKVLVIEELDPVIEEALIEASYLYKSVPIYGKKTNHLPKNGEYSYELLSQVIGKFLDNIKEKDERVNIPSLPVRPPTLCAGCAHRASFYAFKEALKKEKAVFSGDIGCYTLGNAKPLEAVHTCLCMGAGITIAQGLQHVEPDTKNVAFIGDSTFFHTGIPGIINAVYNNVNMTVVVLDNDTTAMTGHQPHPGIGVTAAGNAAPKVDIEAVAKACGVQYVKKIDPYDLEAAIKGAKEAVAFEGVSMVIFERACVVKMRKQNDYVINRNTCNGCKICVNRLGCPAIYMEQDIPTIEASQCKGCGVCSQICKMNAIEEVAIF